MTTKVKEKKNRAEQQGIAIYEDIERMVSAMQDNESDDEIEAAEQEIGESHYGVNIERVYTITLAGGGPANRIYGEIGDDGEPATAELQHQDWFTEWQRTPGQNEDVLLDYARRIVYAGA
jgi:hypothetical protein